MELMKESYKLQEEISYKNKKEKYGIYILVGVFSAIIMIVIGLGTNFRIFLGMLFVYGCMLLFFGLGMMNSHDLYDNNIHRDLKEIGMKKEAYITSIEWIRKNSRNVFGHKYLFSITIEDEGKSWYSIAIKENKAARILKRLLESGSYPVENKPKISISLYVYKSKVYADLDSVDLTKVKGFEEAEKSLS